MAKYTTKVTCVVCSESTPAQAIPAAAFTAKHGYVDEYLAPSLHEYLVITVRTFPDRFDQLVLCRDAKEMDVHLNDAYSILHDLTQS